MSAGVAARFRSSSAVASSPGGRISEASGCPFNVELMISDERRSQLRTLGGPDPENIPWQLVTQG